MDTCYLYPPPPPRAVPPLPCTPELESHWLLEGACDVVHVSLSRHQVHGGRELVPGCDLVGEGEDTFIYVHTDAHTHTHTHARTHMAVVCDLHLDSLWGAAPGTCAHMFIHTRTHACTYTRTHFLKAELVSPRAGQGGGLAWVLPPPPRIPEQFLYSGSPE